MISTRLHGAIDYLVAALLVAAPFLLGFADGGAAQWTTIGFGLLAAGYSLITDYEFGLARVLSFGAHLAIDVAFAIGLAASPWLMDFAQTIWWPHVAVAAAGLFVVLLSRKQAKSAA